MGTNELHPHFVMVRGVVIEKAKAKDIEAIVATMVDGVQHRWAKRSEKGFFTKD
jgi:hypothetical protein